MFYLNNIFIYIQDLGYGHVKVVRWTENVSKRHGFFANLKKCQFHKDKICFLGYIILV